MKRGTNTDNSETGIILSKQVYNLKLKPKIKEGRCRFTDDESIAHCTRPKWEY